MFRLPPWEIRQGCVRVRNVPRKLLQQARHAPLLHTRVYHSGGCETAQAHIAYLYLMWAATTSCNGIHGYEFPYQSLPIHMKHLT